MAAWKCPKCGREFQREEQQHYCVKPKTVDEYIAAQEERVRPRLEALRSLLRETLPEAEERISWSMPTFWKGQNLIHFAAAKKHVYPGRWTTHIVLGAPEDVDGELLSWLEEAYAFSERK